MQKNKYPTTERQLLEWIECSKNGTSNNIFFWFTIKSINYQLFEDSCNLLIYRHESLRTTFESEEGVLHQVIHDVKNINFSYSSMSIKTHINKVSELSKVKEDFTTLKLNLTTGPLTKFNIVAMDNDEFIVGCIMAHIISDEASVEIVKKDLFHIYTSLLNKTQICLGTLPVQMKEYAIEESILHQKFNGSNLNYWKSEFDCLLNDFKLQNNYLSNVTVLEGGGGQYDLQLKLPALENIDLIFNNRSIFFITTIATWLFSISQIANIIIALPFSSRHSPEYKGVVGYLIQGFYLKITFKKTSSLQDIINEVNNKYYNAITHQHYKRSDIAIDLDRYSACYINNVTNIKMDDIIQMKESKNSVVSKAPFYPLNVVITNGTTGETNLSFHYNREIFDYDMIDDLMIHFNKICEQIVLDPGCQLNRLLY